MCIQDWPWVSSNGWTGVWTIPHFQSLCTVKRLELYYLNINVFIYTVIQGQYDGVKKPMPEYHIKVVGFDQRVSVTIKGYHLRKKYEYFALYINYNKRKIFSYVSWQVKVMTSIRKPKRITIRGNDEREYHYLVKGGEDLRQDQRIEQLFSLMNQAMESDPACKQRNLRIKTYQVIPMTSRFVWLLKLCFYIKYASKWAL